MAAHGAFLGMHADFAIDYARGLQTLDASGFDYLFDFFSRGHVLLLAPHLRGSLRAAC